MREAFGFGPKDLFTSLDAAPVASGSIGQVHRAVLSGTGARLTGMDEGEREGGGGGGGGAAPPLGARLRQHLTPCRSARQPLPPLNPPAPDTPPPARTGAVVAVKVRHPGVSDAIERDFALMSGAASVAARLPALRTLRLEESIKQFAAPLREQVRARLGVCAHVRACACAFGGAP